MKMLFNSSCDKCQIVALSGLPGVGKTTLVKKVYKLLQSQNIPLTGFYTEELREGRDRTGFDIVDLEGSRGELARVSSSVKGPLIGKYTVNIPSFESVAMPMFKNVGGKIVVIDEIGKMELLSNKFSQAVKEFILSPKHVLFCTIPVLKGKPIPLVEAIRNHPSGNVYVVDRGNRDNIAQEIADVLGKKFNKCQSCVSGTLKY